MSPLALVASLTLAIAIGISWLVLALDAPITRRKLVRQIPLPLEHPGSAPIASRRQGCDRGRH